MKEFVRPWKKVALEALARSVPPPKFSVPEPAPPFLTMDVVRMPPFRLAMPAPAPFVRLRPRVATAAMFTAPLERLRMPLPASAINMP